MLSKEIHRYIYIFSLILLGVSIPFSVFLMSVSQFLLATNWLLELDFRNKWKRIKNNKPALYLIGLFLLHVIWMLNSTNWDYGLHDLRIKLPIFVLAILIGSTERLKYKELRFILNVFILSILSSSIVSGLIYFGIIDKEISDVREISIFISHIRLSLLVNMGLFIAYYFILNSQNKWYKAAYIIAIIWFVVFLFILHSYTGIMVLLVVFSFMLIRIFFHKNKLWLKSLFLILVSGVILLSIVVLKQYIDRFSKIDPIIDISQLDKYTANGNKYYHRFVEYQTENGHFVYLFLCDKELENEWNKRSPIPYREGLNKTGDKIQFTLIHYLTSMNTPKDSIGVSSLTEEDIRMIESGYSNCIYKEKYSLYNKFYPIFKQLSVYFKSNYAEGASITQRLEYLKIAKRIINEHFWFGTGTGDVNDEFLAHYAKDESSLSKKYQHRAHNQYLTFFISFGVFGFLASIFFMSAPIFRERKQFLPIVFLLTAFLSMLNEDTLETQAGITFFTYFYALLFVAFSFKDAEKGIRKTH